MEETAERAAKNVDRTEKQLLTSVAHIEPTYSGLEQQLAKFREACLNIMFQDFDTASTKNIEARLWTAHGLVNQKFRPLLAKFREGDGKKKHVERRKAEKLYLDFIKSSMKFYRGFIQRLASHFENVPEVFEIARKFNLDTLSADAPVPVNLKQKQLILRSCHATLIQLGDLSRYRETELNQTQRNWGPAKGYYDLAMALDPNSGQSFNQLAVISLADKDHLRAVYYLYRAVTVKNPPEPARNNLDLEFKKIRGKHTRTKPTEDVKPSSEDLEIRFVIYHAQCCPGIQFPNHEEQRSDILRQLADNLRERPFDTTIKKLCLINIAAEYCAEKRARELANNPTEALKHIATYQKLQSFNIATFCMLLRLLLDELQPLAQENDGKVIGPSKSTSRVTSVTRRILPHLRLYSAWLFSNAGFMLEAHSASASAVDLRNLWQVYTDALSLLVAAFPLPEFPGIEYLLDEDQDTLAFTPFSEDLKKFHHQTADGTIKPSFNDLHGSKVRNPDREMLARIKDLVRDGLYLCKHQNDFGSIAIPLRFAEGRFIFVDESGMESDHVSTFTSPHHGHTSSINSVSREDIDAAKSSRKIIPSKPGPESTSEAGVSESVPSTMENMVNDLVQSEASDVLMYNDPLTPTMKTPTFAAPGLNTFPSAQPMSTNAEDLVRRMSQQSPGSSLSHPASHIHGRPSLPSIWNTAFAPLPGETPGTSPRPHTAQHIGSEVSGFSQRSSALFQEEIAQRQQAIQNRTSPLPNSLPTSPSYQVSSIMYNRSQDYTQSLLSPSWQGTLAELPTGANDVGQKSSPQASFGIIGEPRPKNSKPSSPG